MVKIRDGNLRYKKSFHSFVPFMLEIQDTSIRIREKADELFMQYGLRSVSMDDIANSLGISKKTIYQFYADKDELVNAVVGAIIKKNQATCDFDRTSANNARPTRIIWATIAPVRFAVCWSYLAFISL